jgi:hypothetical protein
MNYDNVIVCNPQHYESLQNQIKNDMIQNNIPSYDITNQLRRIHLSYLKKCFSNYNQYSDFLFEKAQPQPQSQPQLQPQPQPQSLLQSTSSVPMLITPTQTVAQISESPCRNSFLMVKISEKTFNQNVFLLMCISVCLIIHGISIWQYKLKIEEGKLSKHERSITDGMITVSILGILYIIGIIFSMIMCNKMVSRTVEIIFIFLLIATFINLICIFIIVS